MSDEGGQQKQRPALLVGERISVTRQGRTLLRGVDIVARGGSMTTVLGPSGAGKTSLFRVLVGEERPDHGTVKLLGADVTRAPLWERARRGLGYLPQGPSVLLDLDVGENLRTFAAIASANAAASDPHALAARVGLTEHLSQRAGSLSGGERRRLELARALIARPRVLVVDEPFSGVDPKGARALATLLRSLADEGVAVLLSDHHVDEALSVADEAILLIDGAIELKGTPDELRAHPLAKSRYLAS